MAEKYTKDNQMKNSFINDKTILITGGTGSFGKSVVHKLIKLTPGKIIIFSRDEKKQFDMRNYFNSDKLQFVVGDVRDKESVMKYMRGVDFVFHAAALKQVPSCEFFPLEAVKTNVLGASNVIEAACANNIKRLVVLSTDKAVYPINAMGMSKALMEKVMLAASKAESKFYDTTLCGVRYGNVMCSRGSVIPYFFDLMKKNFPLTITDGDMTRFLLSLDDAIDLVLFALQDGKNGTMYIRKAPACTILTLAKAMEKITNYKGGIKEVGIRAGEKMHESLISTEEKMRSASNETYYEIQSETQGLDYEEYFVRGKDIEQDSITAYSSDNTKRLSVDETVKLLLSVSEFKRLLNEYKKHTSI